MIDTLDSLHTELEHREKRMRERGRWLMSLEEAMWMVRHDGSEGRWQLLAQLHEALRDFAKAMGGSYTEPAANYKGLAAAAGLGAFLIKLTSMGERLEARKAGRTDG